MQPASCKKLPYFKVNKALWTWSERKAKEGCEIVEVAQLSMDKAPPPLRGQPVTSAPIAAHVPQETVPPAAKFLTDMTKVADAVSRFKAWLDAPDPPKLPKAPVAKPEKVDTVPPFDIQEIPGAMRKLLMPVSAQLMERWFAGALNYSPTDEDEKAEINQDGKPYPPSMYDTSTVTLEWVLRFRRARDQYEALINSLVRNPAAIRQLRTMLSKYKRPVASLDTLAVVGKDPANLHRDFQFQYAGVESSMGQKFAELFAASVRSGGVPDDLTGALGSFNIYAAVAYVRFSHDATVAEVTGIYVYVKDNYTFVTRQNDVSQYLGHWNKNGVVVVPYSAAAALLNKPWLPYVNTPIGVGDWRASGEIYYPVQNRSFRAWQKRHQRGGDFIIYSDSRLVPMIPSIRIDL